MFLIDKTNALLFNEMYTLMISRVSHMYAVHCVPAYISTFVCVCVYFDSGKHSHGHYEESAYTAE